MKIIEFRYITILDKFDDTYPHWSRKYEYPTILEYINNIQNNFKHPLIVHNTCWGFDVEHHQRFKNELETLLMPYNVTNSDVIHIGIPNSCVYDITKEPNVNFKESFDVVLNVSALEEIPGDHVSHFQNLYKQVRPNGYLIITFDLPGFKLKDMEIFLGKEISKQNFEQRIVGCGAPCIDGLNVGLLIVRKEDE